MNNGVRVKIWVRCQVESLGLATMLGLKPEESQTNGEQLRRDPPDVLLLQPDGVSSAEFLDLEPVLKLPARGFCLIFFVEQDTAAHRMKSHVEYLQPEAILWAESTQKEISDTVRSVEFSAQSRVRTWEDFRAREKKPEGNSLRCSLTPRENQVLQEVTDGLSNKEIASKLHISVETVKEHVHRILEKLGCSGRCEAAVLAARHGNV